MFGTALIVFREVLEAALVVSIVAAATRGLPGRGRLIGGGVLGGVLGATLVALFAGAIAQFASGIGQELFNAAVLLSAVALISWHVLWMSRHGRELARHLNAVSAAVREGTWSPTVLLAVVAIAILREGSEVVLFLYGLAASGTAVASLAAGGLLGVGSGIAMGVALYFGLLRIPAGKMFSATNGLLLVVAAGMAATAAHFLIQADLVPTLGTQVWDSSALIANDSALGRLLHALIGYEARPAGMQLVFFMSVLLSVGGFMLMQHNSGAPALKSKATPRQQPAVRGVDR